MRDNKEIRDDFDAICRMDDCDGRLGYEISESIDSYDTVGYSLIRVVEDNPEQIALIESVVTAITGYGFDSIKRHMEKNKECYEAIL